MPLFSPKLLVLYSLIRIFAAELESDMEQLLHYCWKHKMWPIGGMQTTDGQEVEVIDPGLHNRNSGPDFFNAKVKIGGTLWVGNVEIHDKSSDEHYNNVVLHVVTDSPRASIYNKKGLPAMPFEYKVGN